MVVFISIAMLLSAGCTSSSNEGNSPENATTISYQDQEFVSLVEESGSELKGLFAKVTDSLHDSDAAGAITSSVTIMETSDTYLAAIEALTVSPTFEPVKSYYLKALEDYSKAGFNYGLAGEYMKEADFTNVAKFIENGDENLLSAAENLGMISDSGE